jgi:hypothetical protein
MTRTPPVAAVAAPTAAISAPAATTGPPTTTPTPAVEAVTPTPAVASTPPAAIVPVPAFIMPVPMTAAALAENGGNEIIEKVYLVRTYDLVFYFFIILNVENLNLCDMLNNVNVCNSFFELCNLSLYEGLLVLCVIVFTVFRKVTVGARYTYTCCRLGTLYVFQMVQLIFKLFKAFFGYGCNLLCHDIKSP